MPYKTKPAGKGKVKVVGPGGKVHAKSTTPAKAKRQMNLLRAKEHNPSRDKMRRMVSERY